MLQPRGAKVTFGKYNCKEIGAACFNIFKMYYDDFDLRLLVILKKETHTHTKNSELVQFAVKEQYFVHSCLRRSCARQEV